MHWKPPIDVSECLNVWVSHSKWPRLPLPRHLDTRDTKHLYFEHNSTIKFDCTPASEQSSGVGNRLTRPSGMAPSIRDRKSGISRWNSDRQACTACKLFARFLARMTSPT